MDVKSLSDFGHSFQCKIISSLLSDQAFTQQIIDILDVDYFQADANAEIITIIKKYFNKYKIIPTLEAIKADVIAINDTVLQANIIENLKEAYKSISSTDLPFIKEKTLDFCKNQTIRKAILDSVTLLEQGNYDQIKVKIDDAMKSGAQPTLGLDYINEIERRYSIAKRNCIPTRWEVINELMGGGLAQNELGVIIGGPGAGKCVGPNTELTIKYDEIGIETEINGNCVVFWVDPFYKISFSNNDNSIDLYMWQIKLLLDESGAEILIREKIRTIKIKELFDIMGMHDSPDVAQIPVIDIEVKTPYGYKKIDHVFRTKKQQPVTVYFSNGKTLTCSKDHQLKTNGEWKKVKDINIVSDIIETDSGITHVKYIKTYEKYRSLYDIAVKDVHCYYSNTILSHNSWLLQNTAAYALQLGHRVVYYTLELDEDYVGRRFDAIFTGISVQNLEFHKEDIEERLRRLKGNLHIQFFPEYSITVGGLRAHLDRYVLRNMKPDLVVLDYADCLKPTLMGSGRDSAHQLSGDIYSMLKGMAGELQVPILTASQANRGASSVDIIQGHDVADSYIKIMKADFIMSLQRKMEDKLAGTGRIHIIKNRFGPDGLTYPSKINFTNGNVEIFEKNTVEGMETQKKIDNGNEYARKLLSKKFKDLSD